LGIGIIAHSGEDQGGYNDRTSNDYPGTPSPHKTPIIVSATKQKENAIVNSDISW